MRKWWLICAALALARGAAACDICAVYTAMEAKEAKAGLFAGVFERWSEFGTLQEEGRRVDDGGESLRSSITQIFAGYQINRRLGVQVTVPYIDRVFRRSGEDGLERGSESGLGDVVLMGHARLYEMLSEDSLLTWNATAGVKLATGNSDRLAEEAEVAPEGAEGLDTESSIGSAAASGIVPRPLPHGGEERPSGVHGHDLALGSGSTDGLLGTSIAWAHQRWFGGAGLQYAVRGTGDFHYRYADELTWEAQAGRYLMLRHGDSLSLALRLSGEKKGEDTASGERADDTAIDAVYAGPHLSYSHWRSLYAEAALELPLRQDNSGLQLVPDVRGRLGLTWRF